jgi:hypothetical protein
MGLGTRCDRYYMFRLLTCSARVGYCWMARIDADAGVDAGCFIREVAIVRQQSGPGCSSRPAAAAIGVEKCDADRTEFPKISRSSWHARALPSNVRRFRPTRSRERRDRIRGKLGGGRLTARARSNGIRLS